jgi:hypothetical protein
VRPRFRSAAREHDPVALAVITVAYVVAAEKAKSWFYRHERASALQPARRAAERGCK